MCVIHTVYWTSKNLKGSSSECVNHNLIRDQHTDILVFQNNQKVFSKVASEAVTVRGAIWCEADRFHFQSSHTHPRYWWGWSWPQIHKYTNTQIQKYRFTQTYRYRNTDLHKHTDTEIHKYTNTKLHKYRFHFQGSHTPPCCPQILMRMIFTAKTQIHKNTNTKIHKHRFQFQSSHTPPCKSQILMRMIFSFKVIYIHTSYNHFCNLCVKFCKFKCQFV